MKRELLILTVIVIVTNLFLPKELNVLLLSGILFFTISFDQEFDYTKSFLLISPLLILLIVGLFSGLFYRSTITKDFYRDIFYYSKVIIFFISGIAITKYVKSFDSFFRYFTFFVFVSSLVHLFKILINIHSFGSLYTYRNMTGHDDMNEVVLVSICIARFLNKDFGRLIPHFNWIYKIVCCFILISFVAYFSRTMIVIVLILTFFLSDKIYIRKLFSRKNIHAIYVGLAVIPLFLIIYLFSTSHSSNTLLNTLVEKFQRIPQEVFWTSNQEFSSTIEDIQENWRGYEAHQGLIKFNDASDVQKLFGQGFGVLVDLGLIMKLANEDYDKVPVLHNGYVFLLVKNGILGILMYLMFIYRIGFSKVAASVRNNLQLYYSYQMLSAMSVLVLVYTFTNTGLFNPDNATVPIILGFFWGLIQRKELVLKLSSSSRFDGSIKLVN